MWLGPNFKKLVQVGRHNAQVAQALQQGDVLAVRPVEYTFVESQNAVVSVKQKGGIDGLLQALLGRRCIH
jgi:hypothetical protein